MLVITLKAKFWRKLDGCRPSCQLRILSWLQIYMVLINGSRKEQSWSRLGSHYSILCLYRTWLYRNTYISLLIPEGSAKLNKDNLYESRDSYTGTLFIPEFFLSRPYKFFLSGINREYCSDFSPKIYTHQVVLYWRSDTRKAIRGIKMPLQITPIYIISKRDSNLSGRSLNFQHMVLSISNISNLGTGVRTLLQTRGPIVHSICNEDPETPWSGGRLWGPHLKPRSLYEYTRELRFVPLARIQSRDSLHTILEGCFSRGFLR